MTSSRTALPPSPELGTPHPIATFLPALFHDGDFTLRLTAGLDSVLVPVFIVLDSLAAYFDPSLAPEDFLDWLGHWVGANLDPAWSAERKRMVVAEIVRIYRQRGTVAGLDAHIRLVFGFSPEIEESGGVTVSATPEGPIPGSAAPRLMVRLRVPDPSSVDVRLLDALVASAKPAHVAHEVQVVRA